MIIHRCAGYLKVPKTAFLHICYGIQYFIDFIWSDEATFILNGTIN
jgi:hypothetical protein